MSDTQFSLKHVGPGVALLAAVLGLLVTAAPSARAQTEIVVYSFAGGPDGAYPAASLIRDSEGNLYGTTAYGGDRSCSGNGCGTVFKLDPAGTETVLYSFTGGADGASPYAGLIRDAQGNLYGTTLSGGASNYGTVFRVTATGTETVLYSFTGADGACPYAGLIRDAQGNLYGTTYGGGTYGNGTVFKVTLTGTETVLYSFTGGADGGNSGAGLIRDAQGNLYGTTQIGGAYGLGTAFKLTLTGTETVLHSFSGDGAYPLGLIGGGKGIFYGVSAGGAVDFGKVFKLTLTGKEKVLYSFTGGVDGSVPLGIVRDPAGNLYGTTSYGGDLNVCNSYPPGCGVVFKLTPIGTETILYSFTGGADGQRPFAGPIRDAQGNLYGTTYFGGAYGYGTVFEVIP